MSSKESTLYATPNWNKKDESSVSLEEARDAARKMAKDEPITIYLKGGTYFLSKTFNLITQDSRSETSKITYTAYPGETPIISGGKKITGWVKDEDDLWSVEIEEVKNGQWYFHQLFIDDQRRERAKLPKKGFFQVDGDVTLEDQSKFHFQADDIKSKWAETGDVEVVLLQKWAELRMPIKEVDLANRVVTLAGKRAESNAEHNARYWIENLKEGLTEPGNWYLDRKMGKLYYWPFPQEKMDEVEVIAPILQELVHFDSVKNVIFSGLTFAHTDWILPKEGYADIQAAFDIPAAITANDSESCVIRDCNFAHLGGYAMEFAQGCKNNQLIGNELRDLGAGGIKIGDPEVKKETERQTFGNTVTRNHISQIGLVYPAAVGIWIGESSDNTVSHNHIHDTFYTAISVGWTWGYDSNNAKNNIIEFNHIHDIGHDMLSDMGGIYTLGIQPGTIIRNNILHDISSDGYGSWGIYLDEGSSFILVENNLVYRTKTGGFHHHIGKEDIIRNNIFALAREGQIVLTTPEPHLSFTFEHNIVYWENGPLLIGKWDKSHCQFDHNLYFNPNLKTIEFGDFSFEDWQKRGQDLHSLIENPLFENPEGGNFKLKPRSPVTKVGFIPFS